MLHTSIGYHTFVKSMSLTQEEADIVFKGFKKFRNDTGEICIIGPRKYDKDPFGRHFEIVYPNQYKGISWKMRFSNKGFYADGEFKPCSIKAIINPKILTGEKTYIVAANATYLEEVETIFNQEAEKISPMLRRFNNYSLNRLDYCINFNVSELDFNCAPEMTNKIPELIMRLIKRGDIPDHFSEEYKDSFQFYLKSGSVVVNCYWKYDDLINNFTDCPDLDNSYNIIRFEVQFKYPKVYTASASIRKANSHVLSALKASEAENKHDALFASRSSTYERRKEIIIMEAMLSDERCSETIDDYFYKIIKSGDYYTYDSAKRIIEARVSKWEKVIRLTDTLKLISDCEGIAKAKATLQGKKLEDFRRSLRELSGIGINPVTIPKEWNIEHIPNLLDNYYTKIAEERAKEQSEQMKSQMFEDYIKDCKKKGISWLE